MRDLGEHVGEDDATIARCIVDMALPFIDGAQNALAQSLAGRICKSEHGAVVLGQRTHICRGQAGSHLVLRPSWPFVPNKDARSLSALGALGVEGGDILDNLLVPSVSGGHIHV